MKRLLLLTVALVMWGMSFAALTGTKSIPGDYATIAAAIADLNAQGVGAGGVTFNISAGYTETITAPLSVTATGTVTDPIIFQKSGTGANPLITAYVGTATPGSAVQDGIWNLVGSDYVTIDGIDLYDPNSTNPATMEYGYAMFKASATNGSQYNTIKNCVITLSRVNNASGTTPAFDGSRAISVVNSLVTTQTTSVTVTAASGTNSYNKIYSNTVQNCNIGIGFNGYAAATPFTNGDTGNDIGGTSAATGNNVLNYGGATSASNPAAGIRANNQWGINISYNNIDNNNGSGVNHASTLRGIYAQSGTSASATITYNTISIKGGSLTSQISVIENVIGSTAASNTVNISYNTIQNCTWSTATSGTWYGIYNSATPATLNINNNTITNCTMAGTGTFYGISVSSPALVTVNNNNINTISRTGIGTIYAIQMTSPASLTANGNTVYGLAQNAAASTGGTYGIYGFSSGVNITANNNSFHDFTSTGASTFTGIREYGVTGTKIYQGNQIYNFTAVGGSLYGIYEGTGTIDISKNQVYNLNTTTGTGGLVYGIYQSGGTLANIYNNFVSDLKAPAATGLVAVNGIYIGGGTTVNAYYNTVYLNASSTGTTFGTSGIYKSSSTASEFRNNLIVNNSTPGATGGFTVALRWSGTYSATYYTSTSNNNNFYAGAPSASRLVFYDGTNAKQTLGDYKLLVTPRDANSVTELSPFVNVATAPYDLHLNTTTPTQCESGGTPVTSPAITDDIDGNIRNAITPDIGADEGGFTPLPSCVAPVSQPTALVLTPATTTVVGSFTLASGSDSYLVVRSTIDPPTATPVNVTNYAPGAIIGNDTVVGTYTTASFTSTGLHANTTYYFYVYSMNSICGGGPLYLTTSPLAGSVTTAPVDPAAFAATAASATSVNLTATANATGSNIIVAWNTTNVFGTPSGTLLVGNTIPGGGTVLYMGAAASLTPHNGLTAGTVYYYKTWSYNGTAYSNPGLTANATTFFGVTYTQDFNASTSYPTGWAGDMSISSIHGNSATNGLYRNLYSSVTTSYSTAPVVSLSANPCELKFDYRIVNYSGYPATGTTLGASDKIDIQVSTDLGTTYSTIYTINSTNHVTSNAFATKIMSLASYSGNVKVKILGTWGAGDYYIDFDNFIIEEIPACTVPTGIAVSGVTNNAASISWGGAAKVDIDWGASGHPAGTGNIISGTMINPYYLSGLTGGTAYTIYLRQDCGNGNYSQWSGAVNFITACDPISSLPWTEGFESITTPAFPNCWLKENGDWVTSYSGQSSYAPNAHTGVNFLRETYGATNEFMWTPGFQLTGGTSYDFTFWWAGDGYAGWIGDVFTNTVQNSTSATQLGTSFLASTTTTTMTYAQVKNTFIPAATGTYYFAIRVNATSVPWYLGFDDFSLDLTPPCPAPTAVTASSITNNSASISWTSTGTLWDIDWGVTGHTAGTGTIITGVTNPHTISGLTGSTGYDVYVRNNCGVGGFSPWGGPASFTTGCDPLPAPWEEHFDTQVIPTCWSISGPQNWIFTNTWPDYGADLVTDHTGNGGSFAGVDGSGSASLTGITMNSPIVNVSTLTSPQVSLWIFNNNISSTLLTDEQQLVIDVMHGTTSIATYTWDYGVNFAAWQNIVIPFTKPVDNLVQLRFVVNKGTNYPFYDDMIVDDVKIMEVPPCPAPTALSAGASAFSADLSWTSTASVFDVEYGPAGFTPTGVATPGYSSVANPVTVTGLTPATSYDFYVRSNCGGSPTLYSDWSGPKNFTTLCQTFAIPFCEAFSAATMPVCWTEQYEGAITSSHWSVVTTTNAGGTANEARAYYSPSQGAVETDQDRMVSPAFNPNGAGAIKVSFKQMLDDYAAGLNDVWVKVQYSTDKTTWTDAWSYAAGLGVDIAAETKTLVIPVTGNPAKMWVAWTLAGYTYDINYWYVDDICIEEAIAHDVATTIISLPGAVPPATPVTPTADVKNMGANTETFDVTMTISDGYVSTKTVTSLAPGFGTTVTFDSWTPVLGNYNTQVCTGLATDMNTSNDCMNGTVQVKNATKIYGYNAYDPSSSIPSGPVYFYDINPGAITSLATSTTDFLESGSWVNGVWYGSEYYDNTVTPATGGGWYTVDPTTGAMTLITNLGMAFTGLAYDHTNNILYGMNYSGTSTNDLYKIVPSTGVATLVGTVTALAGELAIDIGYSGDGFIYANCIGSDHLWKINPTTLVATDLGATGYSYNYAQGMGYDYGSNTMYLAAYIYVAAGDPTNGGALQSVNLTTGAATMLGYFQGRAEIDGIAIPYTSGKTLNLSQAFLEGLYAGEGAMNPSYNCDGLQYQADTADMISIELHNSLDYWTIEYTASAALSTAGTATLAIPADKSGSYYLTVKNRSTVETTSASAVNFSGAVINYAFNPNTQSYGPNMAVFIDGTAAFYTGDENQDGLVDGGDLSDIGNLADYAACGYVPQDLNGDGLIDGSDLSICGNNADFAVGLVTP